MRLDVHHYHHYDLELHKELSIIMATLQNINDAVTAQATVEASVVTMLQGLTQQIKDAQASNDPVAMDKVVANIQANTKVLSDAVAANTPVAPAVPAPTTTA